MFNINICLMQRFFSVNNVMQNWIRTHVDLDKSMCNSWWCLPCDMWSHVFWTHWRLITCGGGSDIGCCAAISGFVDSVVSWTLCFLSRMVRIKEMLYSHWFSATIKTVQEDQQGLYLNEMHVSCLCCWYTMGKTWP